MTAENKRYNLPEWTTEEHQRDLAWIDEHLELFWNAAAAAFEQKGRGVVTVDLVAWPREGIPPDHVTFVYLAQAKIEEFHDEDVIRFVQEYKPEREFVIMLLKLHDRSAYKIPVQFVESDGQVP
jgi:hypothetical protein